MTTKSSSTSAPSYHSPQLSPPPQYTVVPPTPHNDAFVTRFIESVPGASSSSPMALPILHAQPRTQTLPISTVLVEENKPSSPVRSNSVKSVLSRRVRHASLRLSPTAPAHPSVKDDRHTRSSSSTVRSPTRTAGSPQHAGQPLLPQISRISPMISPSQLPPLSATGLPTEAVSVSLASQGHNASTVPATRGRIPDFEDDAPASPGSIASTGITPSLMVKRAQLEKRIQEAMNDFMHDQIPDPILPDQQHQPTEIMDTGESLNREQEAPSQRSQRLDKSLSLSPPPSHKSTSKRSQRSVSQPMPTTTPSHHLLERHPNQLFAMGRSTQHHEASNASASQLSYASLPVNPERPSQHEQTPSNSIIFPPNPGPGPGEPLETSEQPYYETHIQSSFHNPSSLGDQHSQVLHVTIGDGDREGSRAAVSSVMDSPRRSIPRHDSPEVDRDSDSDRTTPAPGLVQHTLRRRKRESITKPQGQTTHDPSSSLIAAAGVITVVPQPVIVMTGDPGDDSTTSYLSSQSRITNGTQSSGISQPAQAMLKANPPPRKTLDSVRSQVAREMALRAKSSSNIVDGVRVGVADASSAWSGPNDIPFIHLIASSLNLSFALSPMPYLFIITATSFSPTSSASSTPKGNKTPTTTATPSTGLLYITSSSRELTSRAVHLTCSKFIGRITSSTHTFSTPDVDAENAGEISLGLATKELEWMARIKELHFSSFDSDIIHSILLTASRAPLDPTVPPPNSKSISTILEEARAKLTRITPRQAFTQMRNKVMDVPTALVDIRPQAQREEFGEIPGALVVERNVLEWRFDPRCEARLAIADRYDLRVIVFCQEGYTSSLAAQALQQLGLLNATDIIGGYKAWKDAGLPVKVKVPRERSVASTSHKPKV